VSIVIVSHGTGLVLLETLDALVASTPAAHEIIVVDNPPPPGRVASRTMLEGWPGTLSLLTPDENLGFAGGNELGVEHASGDLICFLNPDLVVVDGWLEPLMSALDDPRVGVAAPVLLDPDGSLQEAGQILCDNGWTGAIGGPYVLTGDRSQQFTRDVDYASAACWLVRRAEHVARGGFDLRYHPAFYEDVDYALRVERDGQVTRLVSDRPVAHYHGMGGAAAHHEIACRSFEVFRETWADRIAKQLPRPVGETAGLRSRDRSCGRAVAYVDRGGRNGARLAAYEAARREALGSPRDRVMYLTSAGDGIDVPGGRADGLDVVVGDVDRALAVRSPLISESRTVAGRWSRHARTARREPAHG
jgi:GT2 family glycosyltransferase